MKNNCIFYVAILIFLTIGNAIGSSVVDNPAKEIYLTNAAEANKATLELEAFSDKKLGKLTTKSSKGNNLYSFSIQGGIDEDSKKGTFADLDGLKNGSKVSFNYSRVFFNEEAVKSLAQSSLDSCDKSLAEKKKAAYAEIQVCKAKNKVEAENLNSEELINTLYEERCKAEYTKDRSIPAQCSDYDGYRQILETKLNDESFSTHRIGFELGVGSDRFKWVDEINLASNKDTKSSYGLELQYGYINKNYQRFNAGFRFEERWEGKNAQSVCTPYTASPGSLTCNSIAIGAPSETISRIFYVEKEFYYGAKDSKAASIRLSHNVKTDLTGFDMPIYLYQDKKSKALQGGVRIGWVSDVDTSDKDKHDSDVIFSIFFNKSFSIN